MHKQKKGFGHILLIAFAILFVISLFGIVGYFVADDPGIRNGLNRSANRVVTDLIGIHNFRMELSIIHDARFNPAGSWQVLLDEPFSIDGSLLSKSRALSIDSKMSDEIVSDLLQRLYGSNRLGYKCYFGEDISLGAKTVCDDASRRKCDVTVCVKDGEKVLFVHVDNG